MSEKNESPTGTKPLLCCPFCGSTSLFTEPDEWGSGGQWVSPIHVGCKECKAEQSADTEEEAVKRWNRRSSPAPSAPGDAQDERDEEEGFKNWLYLHQCTRDPDDMNKAEIEFAREAFLTGLRTGIRCSIDAEPFCYFLVRRERISGRDVVTGQEYSRTGNFRGGITGGIPLYRKPSCAIGDARDAARYRIVRRGQHWSVVDGIGNDLRADALDAAIDAALAKKDPHQGDAA